METTEPYFHTSPPYHLRFHRCCRTSTVTNTKDQAIAFPFLTRTKGNRLTFMPARARARRADCAPGPGVLVLLPPVARILMWRAVIPSSCKRRHQTRVHKKPRSGINETEEDGRGQALCSCSRVRSTCAGQCFQRGWSMAYTSTLSTRYIDGSGDAKVTKSRQFWGFRVDTDDNDRNMLEMEDA